MAKQKAETCFACNSNESIQVMHHCAQCQGSRLLLRGCPKNQLYASSVEMALAHPVPGAGDLRYKKPLWRRHTGLVASYKKSPPSQPSDPKPADKSTTPAAPSDPTREKDEKKLSQWSPIEPQIHVLQEEDGREDCNKSKESSSSSSFIEKQHPWHVGSYLHTK
jgi:hypothetical protein